MLTSPFAKLPRAPALSPVIPPDLLPDLGFAELQNQREHTICPWFIKTQLPGPLLIFHSHTQVMPLFFSLCHVMSSNHPCWYCKFLLLVLSPNVVMTFGT